MKFNDSRISRWSYAAVLGAGMALAGCTVGPDYKRPDEAMPGHWAGPTTAPTTLSSTRPSTQPALAVEDLRHWWTQFKDPRLQTLIARAIDSNLDLHIATARLREARATRTATASAFYPQVDANGGYSRSGRVSEHQGPGPHDSYTGSLDASWEVDIFGGVRRGVEASDASVQAAVEDRRDVLVSLTAEVATTYVQLRSFQREIEIAKGNLELQRHSLDLTRRKFAAGLDVGSLDVANAEASVDTTLAVIPQLESSERQAMYSLAVLLGAEPAALVDELTPHSPLPTTPQRIPAGLPSDLLLRRPDVRRAEADLHLATANVGVATADLFPRFSLNGSLGSSQAHVGDLLRIANQAWSIGPSVSFPLFDAGRIRANIEIQKAITEQQFYAYRSTILTALQDVENALIAYDREVERRHTLADAATANRRAVDAATQLYAAGETDFINVLTAQRSLFSSEDALAQSDAALTNDLIALYKALGGGWSEE